MKIFLLTTAFFVLALTACNNNPKSVTEPASAKDSVVSSLADLTVVTDIKMLLCQNWENKEDAEDAALSGVGEGLELPYRGISFFNDGTVVENPRDKIWFGKWSLNEAEKMIDIEFNKGGNELYKIVTIGAKQMTMMRENDKKKIEYRADAQIQKNIIDDPFYGANNQWRIKPGKPESDSAIKARTAQCVLFYAKFMEDNANRKSKSISFVGLPTCFKWYRGGVSVTSKDKLEPKWLNCFYNNEQAYMAHAMLESIIGKKYKWNKEEPNWVKQSSEVVRQIFDTLKSL